MAAKQLFSAAQFIAAIPGTGGIKTAIARRVGCTRGTVDVCLKRWATVRRAWEDECESVIDLAEVKTIEAIRDGDGQMIRCYLSTKGKHRGYTERHEMTGPEGGAIPIREVIVNLSHESEQVSGDSTMPSALPANDHGRS